VRARGLPACALATLALACGCGSSHRATSRASDSTTTVAPPLQTSTTVALGAPHPLTSTVAAVKGNGIDVFRAPAETKPLVRFANPNEDRAPRVFLVTQRQGDWLRVLLPMRPNGTQGWIRTSEVTLSENAYRILIEMGAHRIRVWRGSDVVTDEPVGVGRGNTPTPGGQYYITELLRQPNPSGAYGPYAYGLSGYSNVLRTFAGRDGVIGLHGTNDPAGLGHDVSHGCIRMSNAGITKLANQLPLGTPVVITA
jgi:lipoprotein-anchoring transpeptidase ErfK/SrfK